jgi:hypothetical protein
MSHKKHRRHPTLEYLHPSEQRKSQLFSKTDAKSVEISGYTTGFGAPQANPNMSEHAIPTGVGEHC